MIKLIAIDLDGTLLNSNKEISPFNKEVLKKAKNEGIKVVLCTGRPIMGVQDYLEELDLLNEDDYCITFNGGLVQKTKTGEIVASKVHSLDDVTYMYHQLNKVNLPVNIIDTNWVYEPTYPKNNESYYPKLNAKLPFLSKEIDMFEKTHTFNKAVVCFENAQLLDTQMAKLPKTMYERFSIFKSQHILYEIMPKQVNKGFGIRMLCDLLNIKREEVFAAGDQANDIEMIEYAGFGTAMGNAIDELKQVAKSITDTNDNDGVGKAILKLLNK